LSEIKSHLKRGKDDGVIEVFIRSDGNIKRTWTEVVNQPDPGSSFRPIWLHRQDPDKKHRDFVPSRARWNSTLFNLCHSFFVGITVNKSSLKTRIAVFIPVNKTAFWNRDH
jgi:hypothetical protein